MSYISYTINPDSFVPLSEKAGCLIEAHEEILLLLRKSSRLWELPNVKLQPEENPLEAVTRGVSSEINLKLSKNLPNLLRSFKVRKEENFKEDFLYYLFKINLFHQPDLKIASEYEQARWVSIREAYNLRIDSEAVYYLRSVYL